MKEFTITFHYKNREEKAGVIKTGTVKEVEYNIRPISPEIVRKFGEQIKVSGKGQNYQIQHHAALEDKAFYSALIKAIHLAEHGKANDPIKIMVKKRETIEGPKGEFPHSHPLYPKEDQSP